jgi:predicted Zn finger-like uncharacterized protein
VFTQCAKCETVFRLSAEVLRAAGGQVRCGKCGVVFNALAHLAEDASAFAVGESSFDLETRADSILESPAAPSARDVPRSDDAAPPGAEIARLQILDWTDGEAKRGTAQPIAEIAETTETAETADTAEDPLAESSLEFTLPPGELDRIFVENKKLPRGPTPDIAPESVPADEPEEIEIFNAAAVVSGSSAAAPSGFEVSEDVRQEMLSGMESSSDAQAILEIARPGRARRRRTSPFAAQPPLSGRAFIPWVAAALVAASLLVIQIVHQNREWLAAHTPLGGVLRAVYSSLGAPVAPPANLSAYQLRQWGVTGDPSGGGTLRVRASILNTAAQLEPYPLLRVTLANRFGGSIGTRDFEPSEYLGKPTAKLLAPGERADATLDILDPGKSAEGFEIDVCLRGADRRVACANDKAPAQAKR